MDINIFIIVLILLILVSILICLLSINQKSCLGGGQLATLNNGVNLIQKMDSMSEIKSMQKMDSVSELNSIAKIQIIEDKKAPTNEELDRMFSIDERSRPYTYDELRIIYYKLHEPFKNINSEQLWSKYLQCLKQKIGGVNCSDAVYRQINTLINRYPYPELILNDNKISLLQLFTAFDEILDIRDMYSRIVGSYPNQSNPYQKLTQLLTYKNIYGMQNFDERFDCNGVIKFLRYLYSTKKIQHILCLQNRVLHGSGDYTSPTNIRNILSQKFLYAHDILRISYHTIFIEDYTPYTFQEAMQILALIDYIGEESIVIHCSAGWGRTGSVMYLIIKYKKCIEDPSLLLEDLPKNEEFDISTEFLSTEYTICASREFFGLHGEKSTLRSKRINMANEAIAHRLSMKDGTRSAIRYKQYNNIEDLNDQIVKETGVFGGVTEAEAYSEFFANIDKYEIDGIRSNIIDPTLTYIDNTHILLILPADRDKSNEKEIFFRNGTHEGKRYIIKDYIDDDKYDGIEIPLNAKKNRYNSYIQYVVDEIPDKEIMQELIPIIQCKLYFSIINREIV